MLNVHSSGKEPYLSAPTLRPKTFFQNLKLILSVSVDVVKVIVLSVFGLIKWPIDFLLSEDPKSIKGQNALITGGANGIGKAIALELAKCGCNVIIADVDENASEKTLKILRKFDVKSIAYSTDVSSPKEVENLKESIEWSLGSVDILVNNAGLMPLISLREGCSIDIERIVAVNLTGNLWTIRTFIADMIHKKRGHIVQISSMSALHPLPGASLYTATKYAVTGLMLALEEELRQEGHAGYIDFTTVYPYFVSTRRDLMNTLNLRFPAITAQQTAKKAVKGLLFRKRSVVIPQFDSVFTNLLRCLPYQLQCLTRDHILREPETRIVHDPFLYVT